MVALQVGAEHAAVTRVVAVAPPLVGEVAAPARVPTLLLTGDRDSYCPPAAVATYTARLAPGSMSHVLAGADHFFGGYEAAITAAVRDGLAGDPR
jgi:pimeloyl-ACP methyl ester carboxylesterase